MTKRFRRWAGA